MKAGVGTTVKRLAGAMVANAPACLLQRRCACETNATQSEAECADCRSKRLALQRRARSDAGLSLAPPIVHEVLRSPGRPLGTDTRTFMNNRFGHDFGDVRIHTDAAARKSARAVHALAYTVGRHVVFGGGQYAPSTGEGRRLLAHELSHVIQQNFQEPSGVSALSIGLPSAAQEVEADQAAAAALGHEATDRLTRENTSLRRACGRADIGTQTGCIGKSGEVSGELFQFRLGCDDLKEPPQDSIDEMAHLRTFAATISSTDLLDIHGFASLDGPADLNEDLSCARAKKIRTLLSGQGLAGHITALFKHGEVPGPVDDRRSAVVLVFPSPPATSPLPLPPLCPRVPAATPPSCNSRHTGYCDAATCFPADTWIPCACTASGQICDAIDAFTFRGAEGTALASCAFLAGASPTTISAKGLWFQSTNSCIWGHWRAALDALHDPSRPVGSSLTPKWTAAVSTCRTTGVGSKACCEAQVEAEQNAIDSCGPYDSIRFGLLPTDVPGSPRCSNIVAAVAPGPAFTGDFGKVADRIAFGKRLCCP